MHEGAEKPGKTTAREVSISSQPQVPPERSEGSYLAVATILEREIEQQFAAPVIKIQEERGQWESKNGVAAVDVKAAKPVPRPYWRSSVRPFLVLTPDEISDRAYTICWQGVISPVVCTSGAEVCW
jgi:hypothetical protein